MADKRTPTGARTLERQQDYMKRKGLKRGTTIGPVGPAVVVESQQAYMARKGLEEGDPIVASPGTTRTLERQDDYLERKAAEADSAAKAAESKAKKGDG